MGQVLYYYIYLPVVYIYIYSLTKQEKAAARAVCLGSHAAHGDYGDCDSASVPRLGSARP